MGMRTDVFETVAVKTARTFSRRSNINVVFAGDNAETDGDTIYLPSLDRNKEMSNDDVRVARGYIDHEAAHVDLTDMRAYTVAIDAAEARGDELYPMILNALEDVRIERVKNRQYPGIKKNLSAVSQRVGEMFETQHMAANPDIMEDFRVIGPVAITWEGRRRMDYDAPSIETCLNAMSGDMRKGLDGWVDALDSCHSTADVVELANIIATEIDQQSPPPPQDGGGCEGGSGGDGQGQAQAGGQGGGGGGPSQGGRAKVKAKAKDGLSQGRGSDAGKGQGQEASKGDGNEGQGVSAGGGADAGAGGSPPDTVKNGDVTQGDPSDDHGGSESGGGAGGEGEFNPTTTTGMKRAVAELPPVAAPVSADADITRILGDYNGTPGKSGVFRPFSTANDKVFGRREAGRKNAQDPLYNYNQALDNPIGDGRYTAIVAQMRGSTNTMRRKMQRALLAKRQVNWDGGKEDGKLDNKRFAAVVNGKVNVFKRKRDTEALDTAVTILVDLSGSMQSGRSPQNDSRKIDLAQLAAISVAEALDTTGVALEVMGFGCHSGYTPAVQKQLNDMTPEQRSGFGRLLVIDMYVFKDFEESLRQSRRAMGVMAGVAGGWNADSESLLYAYQRLAVRPEQKKIMLVMSDGQPAGGGNGASAAQHLRDVIGMMTDEGVSCIGVGIMSSAVSQFYPKYEVLSTIDELPKAVMDNIARMILGEGFAVDNADLLKARKLRK